MGVNPKKYSDLFSPWKIKICHLYSCKQNHTISEIQWEIHPGDLNIVFHSVYKWENNTWSTDENSYMKICSSGGNEARKNGSEGKNGNFMPFLFVCFLTELIFAIWQIPKSQKLNSLFRHECNSYSNFQLKVNSDFLTYNTTT